MAHNSRKKGDSNSNVSHKTKGTTTYNKKSPKNYNNTMVITPKMKKILKAIAMGKTSLTEIIKHWELDKGNTHTCLKSLISKGIIQKDEIGKSYFLTPLAHQFLVSNERVTTTYNKKLERGKRSTTTYNQNQLMRSENIGILFNLRSVPKDWESRRLKILQTNNIEYETANLKNHNIYSHTMMGVTVKNTTRSILVLFSEVYGNNSTQTWCNVLNALRNLTPKIERLYNIQLPEDIEIVSQEHADIQGMLSKYKEKKEKGDYWIFYDPIDGKARWKIDKSKGFREFETMHSVFGDADFDKINMFLWDYCKSDTAPLLSDVAVNLEQKDFTIEELRHISSQLVHVCSLQIKNHSETQKDIQQLTTSMKEMIKINSDTASGLQAITKVMETQMRKQYGYYEDQPTDNEEADYFG